MPHTLVVEQPNFVFTGCRSQYQKVVLHWWSYRVWDPAYWSDMWTVHTGMKVMGINQLPSDWNWDLLHRSSCLILINLVKGPCLGRSKSPWGNLPFTVTHRNHLSLFYNNQISPFAYIELNSRAWRCKHPFVFIPSSQALLSSQSTKIPIR